MEDLVCDNYDCLIFVELDCIEIDRVGFGVEGGGGKVLKIYEILV